VRVCRHNPTRRLDAPGTHYSTWASCTRCFCWCLVTLVASHVLLQLKPSICASTQPKTAIHSSTTLEVVLISCCLSARWRCQPAGLRCRCKAADAVHTCCKHTHHPGHLRLAKRFRDRKCLGGGSCTLLFSFSCHCPHLQAMCVSVPLQNSNAGRLECRQQPGIERPSAGRAAATIKGSSTFALPLSAGALLLRQQRRLQHRCFGRCHTPTGAAPAASRLGCCKGIISFCCGGLPAPDQAEQGCGVAHPLDQPSPTPRKGSACRGTWAWR